MASGSQREYRVLPGGSATGRPSVPLKPVLCPASAKVNSWSVAAERLRLVEASVLARSWTSSTVEASRLASRNESETSTSSE
eukprot:CAMPEP_0170575712 /NCGR_PEP_ID=MMETSP0224-20130122/4007_1 /TAXON_ID=285029 /ORGANISM="Togula jolla, Strain CCCM 725" /LENGTH=81 /DNA_ID=CAMNT_0010898509 /DNA_START=428 /DNA_END=670 /DNA_ORIENTATION=+